MGYNRVNGLFDCTQCCRAFLMASVVMVEGRAGWLPVTLDAQPCCISSTTLPIFMYYIFFDPNWGPILCNCSICAFKKIYFYSSKQHFFLLSLGMSYILYSPSCIVLLCCVTECTEISCRILIPYSSN